MSDFNYGDIIEYIDGTLDDNFTEAKKFASANGVPFEEIIDKRDLPKRYFQIGEKQEEPIAVEKPLTYREKREREYPSIQEQLDMLYWDKTYETNVWFETISAVKAKFPKE